MEKFNEKQKEKALELVSLLLSTSGQEENRDDSEYISDTKIVVELTDQRDYEPFKVIIRPDGIALLDIEFQQVFFSEPFNDEGILELYVYIRNTGIINEIKLNKEGS